MNLPKLPLLALALLDPTTALPGPAFARRARDLPGGTFEDGQPHDGQGRGAPLFGKHTPCSSPTSFCYH